MATPVPALQRKVLNWKSGPIEVLPLLPAIRECQLEIEPPSGFQIVLLIDGLGYFTKFHTIARGPATSPNIKAGKRLDNLIVALSFAVFISKDMPSLSDKLFVELVKTDENGNRKHQSR